MKPWTQTPVLPKRKFSENTYFLYKSKNCFPLHESTSLALEWGFPGHLFSLCLPLNNTPPVYSHTAVRMSLWWHKLDLVPFYDQSPGMTSYFTERKNPTPKKSKKDLHGCCHDLSLISPTLPVTSSAPVRQVPLCSSNQTMFPFLRELLHCRLGL
jgi:hypothetical protein